MKPRTNGFTLIEMIGVVAVIAILASVAAPMIFEAIAKARSTQLLGDIKTLRSAVSRYYEDTGQLPVHIPSSNNDRERLLTRNSTSSPVPGWNGPYISADLRNPFVSESWIGMRTGTQAGQQFDFDGDGVADTTEALFVSVDVPSDEQARFLSNALDSDGEQTSGDRAWFASGRVKRWGGNAGTDTLLFYIAEQ